METKTIKLTDEELLIIVNRLSLGTEVFNKAVEEQNYMTDKEGVDNASLSKISALHNKLLFLGQDENNIVIQNTLDSLNWLTTDCILEVKRLWKMNNPENGSNYNPRVKAIKLIMALGESNGFTIGLKKAAEIKDEIMAKP